jgi:decaprenylphospho-beta-D-erythro-pentofuranosid-2-ulose 2-reductase
MTAFFRKHIVVVGGTSSIAQHTLRAWLGEERASVLLIGRDQDRLDVVRNDLAVRFPTSVITTEALDLSDSATIDDTTSRLLDSHDRPDVVLIAHASAVSQEDGQSDLGKAEEQLLVTGVSPSLWLQSFAEKMTSGTIAVVGSVAGDRGRRRNYLYGSGKSMVAAVAQGLQNRYARTDLHIVLVKPGPTATRLTADLEAAGARLADVVDVGQKIARGVSRNRLVVFAPPIWQPIMLVVRALPASVFNRLDL